jgi:AraC-like DNA-binding protein
MSEYRRQLILALLAYAANRGMSVEQICKASDVSLEELTSGQGVITTVQQNRVWLNASKLCRDDLLGLHFGESLQLSALGAVGEIVKSSASVGKALTVACSLVPLITDLFTMRVSYDGKHITITLECSRSGWRGAVEDVVDDDDFVARQMADFLMMFTIHELDGLLLKKIVPIKVSYVYPSRLAAEYIRAFREPQIENGAEMSITLHGEYWDLPILTGNYELQRLFPEKVSATIQRNAPASFQARVLDYLMRNAYLGICSLEDVAANFSMTPRSLQRRLRDESVTFQQLADDARKSLALHYLQSGKYQIKEISHFLGYNELSAFSRAFKRWTGKSPLAAVRLPDG